MKKLDARFLFKSDLVTLLIGVAAIWTVMTALGCSGSKPSTDLPSSNPVASSPGTSPGSSPAPTPVSTATTFGISFAYSTGSTVGGPVSTLQTTPILHRTATTTALGVPVLDADWSNPCTVQSPANQPTAGFRDYYCTLEIAELDLYFNNLNITWSAPGGMCEYVETSPYWFYQYQSGISLNNSTSIQYTTNSGSITFDTVGGIVQNAGGNVVIRSVNNVDTVMCAYDYSWMDPPGPNCCQGSYTQTVTTVSGATSTTATSTASWNGSVGNCAGGPAADVVNWLHRDPNTGLPMSRMQAGLSGVDSAGLFALAPIWHRAGPLATDVETANFVSNIAPNPVIAPVPPAALTDGNATYPGSTANPYYRFVCYDQAQEAIASITLQVRRWTTDAQLSLGPAGNPNLQGNELPFPGPLDDHFNWDDETTLTNPYPGLGL